MSNEPYTDYTPQDEQPATLAEPVAAYATRPVRPLPNYDEQDRCPVNGMTFQTNAEGLIILNKGMKEALLEAERDYAEGRCIGMAELQKEFAQWL